MGDLTFVEDGVILLIKRSKTNQRGAGREVGVPFGSKGSCPVRALRRWLDMAGIIEGAAFRGIDRAGRSASASLARASIAPKSALSSASVSIGRRMERTRYVPGC